MLLPPVVILPTVTIAPPVVVPVVLLIAPVVVAAVLVVVLLVPTAGPMVPVLIPVRSATTSCQVIRPLLRLPTCKAVAPLAVTGFQPDVPGLLQGILQRLRYLSLP